MKTPDLHARNHRYAGKGSGADHGKGFMYTDEYEAGSAIKAIADKRGISILLLHHTNKLSDDGKDMMDTVSGSTGVTGSVDHILFLKRNRLRRGWIDDAHFT